MLIVEKNIWKGNFRDARLNMEENNLTRFEKLVFGPIVKQLTDPTLKNSVYSGGRGFINVSNSIEINL